ncbi:TPA: cell division protein DivIVA, partial [Streptococcus pneumoniae]
QEVEAPTPVVSPQVEEEPLLIQLAQCMKNQK